MHFANKGMVSICQYLKLQKGSINSVLLDQSVLSHALNSILVFHFDQFTKPDFSEGALTNGICDQKVFEFGIFRLFRLSILSRRLLFFVKLSEEFLLKEFAELLGIRRL